MSIKSDEFKDEDNLTEKSGDREDRYLQTIRETRSEEEQAGDQKTIEKLDQIYNEIQDKIKDIKTTKKGIRQSEKDFGKGE